MKTLQRWKLDSQFDKPFTAALIGSTKSGKTTLLNYLVPKIHKNFDIILFYSTNAHAEVYEPIVKLPNVYCFAEFKDTPIKLILDNNKRNENEIRTLVLMDDEINNKNSVVLKNLFSTLRNSNFSTIFSGQDYTFISKSNRNNINYVFIFKQNSNQAIEDVYKLFLKGNLDDYVEHKDKRKFEQVKKDIDFVKQSTLDHNMLILDILNDYKLYTFKVNI